MVKLDENLGLRGKSIFLNHGIETSTVFDQNLAGVDDDRLIEVCREENRVLVTLDTDFGNIINYDPRQYAGIALIRVTPKTTPQELYRMVEMLARNLKETNLKGKLWVVQPTGIREYQPDN